MDESQKSCLESNEERHGLGCCFMTCGEGCDASLCQIPAYLQHHSLRKVLMHSSVVARLVLAPQKAPIAP